MSLETLIHKATCTAWVTNDRRDCNCVPPYRIRRRTTVVKKRHWWRTTVTHQDKWEVARFCDGVYEPFLKAPSFESALRLATVMTGFGSNFVRSEQQDVR